MDNILIYILIGVNAILLILVIGLFFKKSNDDEVDKKFDRVEKVLREELSQSRIESNKNISELRTEEFKVITAMGENVDKSLEKVKDTVDERLKNIQKGNEEKLEKMRETVDEKLHKTLEERLGQSFKMVSEKLEHVHKGLGEMQNLAEDVGGLKKVLSGVKTRGILGERQLENILEQILSPEQYVKNAKTNPNTSDSVEFAIRMPGKKDEDEVYLPVDSKFPIESYYRLMEAYDMGDKAVIETESKALESAIKKSAKDISTKYIYPPNTTDFAILFIPIESLYAEIIRRGELMEFLQNEHKIVVSGPTVFAAFLNSLQMGFKTLAIEKRSGEVWNVLAAVKKEFNTFGDVLEKTQKRITDAGEELDKLVGVRSKKIMKQLNQVSSLSIEENDEDEG